MHARTHARAVKTGHHQLAQPFSQSVVSNFAFTRRFKDPPPPRRAAVLSPLLLQSAHTLCFFFHRANARFPFFQKKNGSSLKVWVLKFRCYRGHGFYGARQLPCLSASVKAWVHTCDWEQLGD
jgi:hypothetical protein